MDKSKVGAVVVSYNPSPAIFQNIVVLSAQVGHVFIIDNTSCSAPSDVLNDVERLEKCTVLRNNRNLGIAAALNIGIRHAIAHGSHLIMTFDQDSQVTDGYVQAMLSTYAEVNKQALRGVLCPRHVDVHLKIEIPKLRAVNGEIVGCMTSGSMIEAKIFTLLGPIEEQLFIDYVDYEYCLRMRAEGFKVIECPDAILLHSLGRITLHHFMGRELIVTNHSPKRRYYITRNRLVLIRRYFQKDREWALAELKNMLMDSAIILLVEDQKFAKAAFMIRALYDGMLNRLGARVDL